MSTLYPLVHNRKVGLADATGQLHVAPTFDDIGPLSHGRRRVSLAFKYGFLDGAGREAIALTFSGATDFAQGLAMATDAFHKAGLIDPSGAWRVQPSYGFLEAITPSLAITRPRGDEQPWGILDIESGRWLVEPLWPQVRWYGDRICVKEGRRWGAVARDGAALLAARWEELWANHDGTWTAREKKKSPWVRLSAAGEVVHTYPGDIDLLQQFRSTYAPARSKKRWGLVDEQGNWVVEPISSESNTDWWHVTEPVPVRVRINRLYGYALPGQGLVIPATFKTASAFTDGHAVADKQVLDSQGQVVATIDPNGPVMIGPEPNPNATPAKPIRRRLARGPAAQALVALIKRPAPDPPDPEVLSAIRRLPHNDLSAVLETWATSGCPWIAVGAWDLWSGTEGERLLEALRGGDAVLPFGRAAADDPVRASFPGGELKILVDTHPEDGRPRHYRDLEAFIDAMVEDYLDGLEDGGDPWPLQEGVQRYLEAGALGEGVQRKLTAHVRRVAGAEAETARDEAAAWLAEHGHG